ncbi:MAG: N-acetyl-alpha-D-glucosaminyl-diphospho-ditrans,octacis-undecaprenol 4-epimerase [bacterium]|nr:N-acetyl-alpha-D-glucosaminyl-diphospho-ditrans,octacis-undecaprenol 4-epimerase [bacterium]
MIAFITGGTGFIGSFLAQRLTDACEQVYCLVRPTSSLKWLQQLPVNYVYGDLFNEAALAEALHHATHVFHLAGVTKELTSAAYFHANGEGTAALLRACSRHARELERFVYVSSIAAAGPSRGKQLRTEEETPQPVSVYGKSKYAGELACAEFRSQMPITIVRPPIVYGPRDRDVYNYFKQVDLGIRLRPGRRERWTSLIHVHDLVRGILLAGTHLRAIGETYFLTNPEPYEWNELGLAIAQALGKKSIAITVPEAVTPVVAAVSELVAKIVRKPALLNFDKIREMRQAGWAFSGEKAKQQLGFVTEIPLAEGLKQTVEWYRENGWL